MTTSGTSGKGVNSKKSLRSKAPGTPKDPTQSAKADSSLLSPAVLMALGMAGMAVAAVPENASGASQDPENLAEQDLAPDASQALPQVAQAPVASDLQSQLADLITDLQAQGGQMTTAALPVDLEALLAAMAPQDAVGMEEIVGASAAGAADMEPILLAQATVPEAAVPQAASAAAADASAAAGATTAGAGAAAAGAMSVSGVLLAAGALGLAAAAGGGGSSSGTSAPSDTVKPTVSTVAITSATGAANSRLNAGDVVTVTVTMSEATTVTGASTINLLIGDTDTDIVQAVYVSGSGTAALTYSYTILAGQADVDGISVVDNTLVGTLKDGAGNFAILTYSGADNASYMVDTSAPTIEVLSASASAGTVTLTYDGPLDDSNAALVSGFKVAIGDGLPQAVEVLSIVGSVVTLSVPGLVKGSSFEVSYTDTTTGDDSNVIQDMAGNDAGSDAYSTGIVADGYVRGAIVTIGSWTGTTDANGNFFVPKGVSGTIVAKGGVNIDTGVANTVDLKAPEGSSTINPLTTLVQAVVETGKDVAFASAAVATSLGLDGLDLLNYDPISNGDLAAQTAAAQIATIVALAGANNGDAVLSNLADIFNSGAPVDLADSTTVSIMLDGVGLDETTQSAIADASTAIADAKTLSDISSAQGQALDKLAPSKPTFETNAINVAAANTQAQTLTVRVSLDNLSTDGKAVVANDVLTLNDSNIQLAIESGTISEADVLAGYKDLTVSEPSALTVGIHSLTVVATDQAGNASESLALTITVDRTAPSAPTIGAVATDNVVSATEKAAGVAVSGTAEAGASVLVTWGTVSHTVAAGSGGIWSATFSGSEVPADTSTAIKAVATDAAGNSILAGTSVSVRVDTAAPTITAAVTGANDNVDPTTGTVVTGGTSNDNTLGLSGTVSAALTSGDVVAVYDGSTRLGVATVSGTTWTFDTPGLSNAAHSFKAQVEDAAGNAGAQGTAYAVTVNATVPGATASVSAMAALTNSLSPVLTGTVTTGWVTGDVVSVYDGTTLLGNAEVSVDHLSWTMNPTLIEGAHSFRAVVQNTGGNQSAFSTAVATTIDATAPTAPVINAVATDNVVNATEQAAGVAVGGTAESGASVAVTWGAASYTVTAINGAWTTTFSNTEVAAGGSATLSAVASDAAGNPSLAGTRAVTVDTAAPSVTGVSVSAGDAINASEFAATAGVTITGATDAGARVDITLAGTTTVLRSVTAGIDSTWEYTLTKADISAMGQGDGKTISVQAVDVAGNRGDVAETPIGIDTLAPVLSSFSLVSDSGKLGDGKSNVAVPIIQLTAESGATLLIDLGIPEGAVGAGYQTVVNQSGQYSVANGYTEDGVYTIQLKATDLAGNTTVRSGSYTYDSRVATPALALASDTSVGQKVTSSGTVNVTGLESGATWEYSLNAGGKWTAGSGSSVALTDDGSMSITVRQTDTAGNLSTASSALAFTLDTLVATPTLALSSDTGSSASDKISQSGLVNVSGLEAGGKWEYSLNAGTSWTTGTQSTVAITGEGGKSITVRQTDTAGNVSTTSTALAFTVDTTIAKPTVSLSSDTGSSKSDNISSSALVTLSPAAADVTRTYTVDGTTSASYTAPTSNAVHTVVVTDTDTAGNVSSSETLTFTLDTTAPTIATGAGGLSPTDGGLSLGLKANLIVTMSEAVATGTGSLTLYKAGELVETIDVSSSTVEISKDGTTVTINPTADLVKDEYYYVKAEAGTFTDTAGNAWAGISGIDKDTWIFKGAGATVTIDNVASDNTVNLVESRSDITVTGTLGAESAVLAAYTVANMTAVLHPANGGDISIESTGLDYKYTSGTTGAWTAVIPSASWSGTADYTLTVSFKGTAGAAEGINGDGVQVVHVDTVAPTVSAVAIDSATNVSNNTLNAGDVVTARVTMSEATSVTGAPTLALNIGGTTVQASYASGSGTTALLFNYTIINESDDNGISIAGDKLALNGGTLKDAAGNVATLTHVLVADNATFMVDTTAPTLAITSPISTGYINDAEDELTLAVAGTSAGADGQIVTLTVGAKSYPATVGVGGAWSVNVTAEDLKALAQGSVSLTATVSDAAGNAATQAATGFVYDKLAPTLAITSPISGGYLNGAEDEATLTVAGTSAGAEDQILTLNVGGKDYTATVGTDGAWSVDVTAEDLKALAQGSVSLTANVSDAAGNAATQATASYVYDTVAPTVTMDVPEMLTDGAATVTFNFSEAVYGFEAADIVVANGAVSNFSASDGGTSYAALITPISSTAPVAFTIDMGAEAANDAAGNLSTVAAQFAASVLVGTSGNDILTVNDATNLVYLGAGTDTIKLAALTGSTATSTDTVQGFGSGDKIDLAAILGSATGGSGYTSSTLADTGSGFVELKNLALAQNATTGKTTVTFDVNFDAATLDSSKINSAAIDLLYDYTKVSSLTATSPTFADSDGLTQNIWLIASGNKSNGQIALAADPTTETFAANPIISSTGKVLGVTLIVSSLVSTFAVGLEAKSAGGTTEVNTANGKVYGASTDSGGVLAVGVTKTAGASAGTTGVLEIVSDTSTLGSGDNQLHMLTTYDSATGLTRLQIQYDSNSTYGTTAASSIIAMDFVGDLTSVLTPASLTFI